MGGTQNILLTLNLPYTSQAQMESVVVPSEGTRTPRATLWGAAGSVYVGEHCENICVFCMRLHSELLVWTSMGLLCLRTCYSALGIVCFVACLSLKLCLVWSSSSVYSFPYHFWKPRGSPFLSHQSYCYSPPTHRPRTYTISLCPLESQLWFIPSKGLTCILMVRFCSDFHCFL